ncbi:MAG TPA: tRNA (guanosine(46)-N7)-methyltransferase TrmB [Bacteroidales bacterium]|nr:tRNA (guanosine(46)-N7)-methyltransferase TrmB [Bacteroidales bacterium]HPT01360.1 tRNA (guanosine(46)-N7)-methyltransferase TrmB [Bacteroidales bacterium]
MAKRKLERFAENATFPHMFQLMWDDLQAGFGLRGRWRNDYFRNENPLILELGCGKGEYTVGLATHYPDKNYIGIDKKGARMWRGAKTTAEKQLPNVAFVRMQIEGIADVFAPGEVDEIWITFPEPHPNSPRTKKRFTSPQFIERYRQILKPEGIIHLKTDSDLVFEYTHDIIKAGKHRLLYSTSDLYSNSSDEMVRDVVAVQTFYEQMWLSQGIPIKYLCFTIN